MAAVSFIIGTPKNILTFLLVWVNNSSVICVKEITMCNKHILLTLVIVVIALAVSSAYANVILTVNGADPTEVPIFMEGIGPYTLAVDGNTPIESNDLTVIETGGTLSALPDVNYHYNFEFDAESTEALVSVVTNTEISIDGITVPAETTIYELYLFCNRYTNLSAVTGMGLDWLYWPEGEDEGDGEGEPTSEDTGEPNEVIPEEEPGEQGESPEEEPSEQPDIGAEETTVTGETINSPNAGRDYDPAMDLNNDGIIDFKDFAILGAEWMITYNIYDLNAMFAAWTTTNPCNDVNVSGAWQRVDFTGIGGCNAKDCKTSGPDYSDYIWDDCGNYLYNVCKQTSEFGGDCAYNYYFSGARVGLCIYKCGRNYFQVRKNASGKRILQTRHRTRDIPPHDPECQEHPEWCDSSCDQGTRNKYDWQIVVFDSNSWQKTGFCRESYYSPDPCEFWDPNQGESSSCELQWW
jgi:hypothetical protein